MKLFKKYLQIPRPSDFQSFSEEFSLRRHFKINGVKYGRSTRRITDHDSRRIIPCILMSHDCIWSIPPFLFSSAVSCIISWGIGSQIFIFRSCISLHIRPFSPRIVVPRSSHPDAVLHSLNLRLTSKPYLINPVG
jgi:hypothetical protein